MTQLAKLEPTTDTGLQTGYMMSLDIVYSIRRLFRRPMLHLDRDLEEGCLILAYSPPSLPLIYAAGSMMVFCCFLLTIPLQNNYLRMYRADLHQIFMKRRQMSADERSDLILLIAQWTLPCKATNWGQISNIGLPHFHSSRWHPEMECKCRFERITCR